MTDKEDLQSSVDINIVADNILGIADYVMERHEFKHDITLTDEQREAAKAKIKDALWMQVEALKLQHRSVLQEMFDSAEKALADVVSDSSG